MSALQEDKKEDNNNPLLEVLAKILTAKTLPPSEREVAKLTKQRLGLAQLSYSAWLEAVADPENPHRPCAPLCEGLGRGAEAKLKDQRKRARKAARLMVRHQLKKIVLMDGHGRFVFALLDALRTLEQDVTEYVISLVDLDPHVADWHDEFIPGPHVHGDVLDLEFENDTFVYLNFCSLSDQKRKTLEFMLRAPKPLMVSFFLRNPKGKITIDEKGRLTPPPKAERKNKDGSLSFAGMINELNLCLNYYVVAQRGLFVTLVVED